jgi:hypothetical protein
MTVHALNIKPRKLKRLERHNDDWVHSTAGSDLNVVDFLEKFWRHDEREAAR